MLNSDFSLGSQNALAAIFSMSGFSLTDTEKNLFKSAEPFGFILFKRNCDNPEQLRSLVQDLKSVVGRDCPILIDQEGGRVQRLRAPNWREYKSMRYYGDLFVNNPEVALEELRFETLRLAEELSELGVNVNCAPVMDLFFDGTTEAIGDRSFSSDPEVVSRLSLSVCRHLLKAGITPVIKHIPGHGRSKSDSHLELPRVETDLEELLKTDFVPFQQHNHQDVSCSTWGMTAHIVYKSLDTQHPVSVSKKGVDFIRNTIGFKGLLLSDDLDMKALDHYGSVSDKALAALKAGCDIALYCAGEAKIMEKMAENLPKISKNSLKVLKKASKDWTVSA